MRKTYDKIITHDGPFHADEVLARALLLVLGIDAPFVRTRNIAPEDFENPRVLILDVGDRYEPKKSNLDHHQDKDKKLQATNMLVLKHFVKDKKLRAKLEGYFFQTVSDTDRGVIPNGGPREAFNALIKNFNNVSGGFDRAVLVATEILRAAIATAQKAIATEEMWSKLERICDGLVVVQETGKAIQDWKDLAKKEGVLGRVFLGKEKEDKDKWLIEVTDTTIVTIPEHETQEFRHNAGFLARYPAKEAAFAHAAEIFKKNPIS